MRLTLRCRANGLESWTDEWRGHEQAAQAWADPEHVRHGQGRRLTAPPSDVPWLELGLERGEPAQLLARSAALFSELEHRARPVLRWYRSTSTALVLGRGQARLQPATSLPVAVRDSGGGAVLMDPSLLSLDVLLPAGHPLLDGDPTRVFVRLGGAWLAALTELGVPALALHTGPAPPRRGDADQQLRAGICYATIGRGEVTSGGRKLVGLSQRRRRWGALVQCGVLGRWDPRPLLAALDGDADDPEIRSAAVGLAELDGPDDGLLIPAVEQAIVGIASRS